MHTLIALVVPATLPAEDREFLLQWLAQAGDGATVAALRGRVRVALALQAEHPGHPPLAALMDDPLARAVLLARPPGRSGVRKQFRRRHAGKPR